MSSKSVSSRVAKRSISLVRPTATIVVPTAAELKTATNTNAEQLFTEKDAEQAISTTRFQVLGQPATMASLVIPPSIPLYVRRGCLISLHGAKSLSMNYEWIHFWFNLLRYGSVRASVYHKLVSTSIFNALVAPNFLSNRLGPWLGLSSSPFRTLCLLNLDGSADWNVWGKDTVVAYESNSSLRIKPPRPAIFSRVKPVFSSRYQTVQGRGNVLLSGSGSVYTVELKDAKDEIVIRSEHLLAVSGSNRRDIASAISEQTLAPPDGTVKKVPGEASRFFESIRELDGRLFLESSRGLLVKVWNWSRHVYSKMINGPTRFLKIKGPRSLLIQSSYNVYLPATPLGKNNGDELLARPETLTHQPSKDYFNYATISKDGNVNFQSTPNFNETVKKIKQLGENKS
ncbi:AIM24 (YJR080C) [Zygosaccharomyces parabailii]|nr:AIM24 (YJR080C) [Zygosaccharomyces parabailii]CDH16532.1 probable Altered inheritance of mitochondria protein 24, mitochondrial [Zygosaccharomyces bailii ISA1307]